MTLRRIYNSLQSIEVLTLAFLAASILVARVVQNPLMIIVVSSLSILLIPLLVGKVIFSFIRWNNASNASSTIALGAVEWFVGNLFIYYSSSILSLCGILEPRVYSFSLTLLPIIFLIIRGLGKKNRKPNANSTDSLRGTIRRTFGSPIVIPFIFLAGLLPLLSLLPLQPFPLSPTQSWVRIRLSISFMERGYVELVRGYSHWISIILSIPATVYDFHPLQVLSATNYLSHIAYPFALYLISYRITKDPKISLVPAFVGPWIFLLGNLNLTVLENTPLVFHIFMWMIYIALEYYHPSSLWFRDLSTKSFILSLAIIFLSPLTYTFGKGGRIIPPNLFVFLSLILPVILIAVYCTLNRSRPREIAILAVFIFPLTLASIAHPYVGLMVVFFLGCFLFALSVSDKQLRKLRIMSAILPIIVVFVFLIASTADNFALTHWLVGDVLKGTGLDINVLQKWSRFLDEGPTLAVFLFLSSFYLICFFGSSVRKKEYTSLVFVSGVIVFVTFLPEGLLWRAVAYLNPLAAVMLSYLLLFPLNALREAKSKIRILDFLGRFKYQLDKLRKYHVTPKSLYVFIALLLIIPNVQFVRTQYFENSARSVGEGYTSWARTYDIDSSFWIYNNFRNESVLIISDPATMFFLGCITGKDTLMIEYVEYYPWEYTNETWVLMQQLKQTVFLWLGKDGSYERIQEFTSSAHKQFESYSKIFLVVSPRTYYWLYKNQIFPITVKTFAVDSLRVVLYLDRDPDFDLVHKIGKTVYIYELRPPEKEK